MNLPNGSNVLQIVFDKPVKNAKLTPIYDEPDLDPICRAINYSRISDRYILDIMYEDGTEERRTIENPISKNTRL